MKKVFLLIIILMSLSTFGQESDRHNLYYKKVHEFYNSLQNKELSIDSVCILLGMSSLEEEEYFFFRKCDENTTKDCVDIFYERINNPQKYSSVYFNEIVKFKKLFLFSGYENSIDSIIENSLIYDEGLQSDVSVDLLFPNGKTIYFHMNKYKDEPVYITGIYFSNGESYYNYLFKGIEGVTEDYLKRLAIINDPDDYTNVRKGKGYNYPVVYKIETNEEFLFTPNSNCNWWKVQDKSDTKNGFMHKSRIKPLGHYTD
ncbi:hypothetical protein ACT3CE_04335 [Marinifilum sp. RC60d5]|uniref:hypothetical protein n=1 Tax=Marinifilum sp. RC60d5 TaxID=3458414 RepID=UPI004036ACED